MQWGKKRKKIFPNYASDKGIMSVRYSECKTKYNETTMSGGKICITHLLAGLSEFILSYSLKILPCHLRLLSQTSTMLALMLQTIFHTFPTLFELSVLLSLRGRLILHEYFIYLLRFVSPF